MVILRRDPKATSAEALRRRAMEIEVETRLGLTNENQRLLDAIAKTQCAIAMQFQELFRAISGNTENVRTVNGKIRQVRDKIKQLTQISKDEKIERLEETVKEEIERNQRVSGIRSKEDLGAIRELDDLEMITVTRLYETEGIAEAFDKSMEKITKALDEFAQEARGDKNSIKWAQARLMIKIINKMSVEALGIVSQKYDSTHKIDLRKIAEDATRCPAMAYLEEKTIEEVRRIAQIPQTQREIEIIGAIIDNFDLFEVDLDKLGRCAQALRRVEPNKGLADKIIKSIKILKKPEHKEWFFSQITARSDMLQYYQEKLDSDKVTEVLFMSYLQFGQEKVNGEEVFDKMKKLTELESGVGVRLILALPQLVHYQIFEEVAQRIERNDSSGIQTLDKIFSKDLDGALEALYPKARAEEVKEEGRVKTEANRERSKKQETEKIKLKHRRIVLVSDETYGRQIERRLNELIDGEVVLIGENNPSVKYIKSIVKEGDIVVIDASHIGHAKSGATVIACRKNRIPYRIGKQTNVDRILEGIKRVA